MKKDFDFDGIIIFLLGLGVAGILFFGMIAVVRKAFRSQPKTEIIKSPAIPSSSQQKKHTQTAREREKEYMRKQREKLRDYRNK